MLRHRSAKSPVRLHAVSIAFLAAMSNAAALTTFAQQPVSFSQTFVSAGSPISVNFSAWAPAGVSRIRGVVFDLPGRGGDSRGVTNDPNWRGKLTSMGFAIVGNTYATAQYNDSAYWGLASSEIGANIQGLLGQMATSLGKPEINNAPLFLTGLSHGGYGAQDIAEGIPTRVLGYVADKGTAWINDKPASERPAMATVPGLMVIGAYDSVYPTFQSDEDFFDRRFYMEGRVAKQIDWTDHVPTNPDTNFAFLDQVYRLRYPQGQLPSLTPGNPLPLVDIPLSSGWLGQPNSLNGPTGYQPLEWPAIDPAANYHFTNGPWERSWLPNDTAALVYRAHNAVPTGISLNALTITPANATDGTVTSGPIDLSINLSEIPYTGIDIYHEDQLITHLNYSTAAQHVLYTPTETGIHTFIAIATYSYNGQTHYTSKYATVGVTSISTALAGDFNNDGRVDTADYVAWRNGLGTTYSQADYNTWRTHFGQSSVTGSIDGDFNQNGRVDAADYVVWRNGLGTVYTQNDYNVWRAHYGQSGGSGSGTTVNAAVPEPTTLMLLFIGMLAMCSCRRKLVS